MKLTDNISLSFHSCRDLNELDFNFLVNSKFDNGELTIAKFMYKIMKEKKYK